MEKYGSTQKVDFRSLLFLCVFQSIAILWVLVYVQMDPQAPQHDHLAMRGVGIKASFCEVTHIRSTFGLPRTPEAESPILQ